MSGVRTEDNAFGPLMFSGFPFLRAFVPVSFLLFFGALILFVQHLM